MEMQLFGKYISDILLKQSYMLSPVGLPNSGKSCWVLNLFETMFRRDEFIFSFDPSGLDGLLDDNIRAIFIDESGEGFNARKYKESIAQIFQWARIFNKLIVLATTHQENNDIIIRDRVGFIEVKMLPPKNGSSSRAGVVKGVGLVRAGQVSDILLKEFIYTEISQKKALTKKLLSTLPSSKYFSKK